MAIEIQKRPYAYVFSGNPVHYQLFSALAAADDKVFFEIRVMFKNISGVYAATEALPYAPVAGVATIDVQDILEGLLSYELPGFHPDEKTVWEAQAQTGKFYLQYREIMPTNANTTWDNSELDFACFVIKGGLSRFKYQGNNFWVNYFGVNDLTLPSPFLSWQVRGRLASAQERMFLLFLNIRPISEFTVYAQATYIDGSTFGVKKTIKNPSIGVCYYIPAGAQQWGLINPQKEIHFWEITILHQSLLGLDELLSETFRYYQDNRNDYNDQTLHYRSSLGSLDSVRIRGVIQYDLEYEYTEQSKTVRPDYFNGHFFQAQKTISNNKELQVMRGDIGHLEKEEQDRLRDVYLNRETWQASRRKWVPVIIITKNIKQKTSEQTRWNLSLDFTLAHEGDNSYTPTTVDLGEGVFTDNVCLAYLSPVNVVVDTTNNGQNNGSALVEASFTEVDPQNAAAMVRYRVLKAGSEVIPWTTIQMSQNPFTFLVTNGSVFSLETQAICTNNVYGKKTTTVVNASVAGPGPGPGPVYNSVIANNTNISTNVMISQNNGLAQNINAGANNLQVFNLNATGLSDFVVILQPLAASLVTIESSGVVYTGVNVNDPFTFVFTQVDVVVGITLNIQ